MVCVETEHSECDLRFKKKKKEDGYDNTGEKDEVRWSKR